MPLKKSTGQMYPWVTHTHASLGGECPHKCTYCYVESPRIGRPPRYQGQPRLLENELKVTFGEGRTIFVENCNDLFAEEVPEDFIVKVVGHCLEWPKNTYVFQTKNPSRLLRYIANGNRFPDDIMIGTTIETNRPETLSKISSAPPPKDRFEAMRQIVAPKFCTVEPIMDFDVDILAGWLTSMGTEGKPYFVNIGADSKGHGLEEPESEKVMALVRALNDAKIEIRKKHNLDRLLQA